MVIAGKHELSSSMDESVRILSHGTQNCDTVVHNRIGDVSAAQLAQQAQA